MSISVFFNIHQIYQSLHYVKKGNFSFEVFQKLLKYLVQ